MASKIKKRFKIDESALLCEDMESAAVGLISLRASVPCSVIRGISNLCGERDYKEWKLTEAAEAAQKALLKYL
jgi:nucleoside phosphorylase